MSHGDRVARVDLQAKRSSRQESGLIARLRSLSATIAPPRPGSMKPTSSTAVLQPPVTDRRQARSPAPANGDGDGDGVVDQRDTALILFWGTMIFSFVVAFLIWWGLFQYSEHPGQLFGLGLWVPNDRPSWLPLHSGYGPLIGQHYFGDFFQLYYAVRTHAPYTNALAPTAVNPGYLLPLALVSWLPYPAGGYVYLVALFGAWLVPAAVIARRSRLLALLYLVGATLSIPGLLALDIGQPEIFLYVLAIAAFCLMRRRPIASAVILGLAIAIKPYMALFLLLFLFKKEYRSAIYAVVIALLTNFLTALYLVHGAVFRSHLWSVILHASLGYGSGNGPQVLEPGAVLAARARRSTAFLYTLAPVHVPVLSGLAHHLVAHYTFFSIALLAVMLVYLLRIQSRLTLETQWLYLAIVFLLIPSFTIGYAWLLLFVPFVAIAATRHRHRSNEDGRFGLLQSRTLVIAVALSVVAYPANIALPARLVASLPRYGPSGNNVLTPFFLLVALGLVAWHGQRSLKATETRLTTASLPSPWSPVRSLHWLNRSLGLAVVAVLGFQVVGATVAYALSVPPTPLAKSVTAANWTGTWLRSRKDIGSHVPNSFTIHQDGRRIVGVFPWPGCVPGVNSFSGKVNGATATFVLLANETTPQGVQPIEIATQTLTLSPNFKKMTGLWTMVQKAGVCRAGESGLFTAVRAPAG